MSLASGGVSGGGIIHDLNWITSNSRISLKSTMSFLDIFHVYIGISLASWHFNDNFFVYQLISSMPRWILPHFKYENVSNSTNNGDNGKNTQKTPSRHDKSQSKPDMDKVSSDQPPETVTIWDILKNSVLRFRLIISFVVWLFVHFASIGIVFESMRLSNDIFDNLLIGPANFIGATLAMILLNYIGRCLTISISLMIYGLKIFVSTQLLLHRGPYQVISFAISKLLITMTLIGLSIHTNELWPMGIQSTVFNICKMFGRLGCIIAAISIILIDINVNLPPILYASAAILSSILLFAFLPETKNCEKSPETIDDALAIGKRGMDTPDNV